MQLLCQPMELQVSPPARGLALYFTGGQNILQLGNFVKIGQGMVGPIPVPVILVIIVTLDTYCRSYSGDCG